MRAWWISLERRGSEYELVVSTVVRAKIHRHHRRNIVTHHAEDGSGLGSAIIAGQCADQPYTASLLIQASARPQSTAMTQSRKEAGHFPHL